MIFAFDSTEVTNLSFSDSQSPCVIICGMLHGCTCNSIMMLSNAKCIFQTESIRSSGFSPSLKFKLSRSLFMKIITAVSTTFFAISFCTSEDHLGICHTKK